MSPAVRDIIDAYAAGLRAGATGVAQVTNGSHDNKVRQLEAKVADLSEQLAAERRMRERHPTREFADDVDRPVLVVQHG